MLKKETKIIKLLEKLRVETRGWLVVDHWDADLCAVGVAACADLRKLVYISTYKQPKDRYYYACEAASPMGGDDNCTVASADGVSFAELLDVMVKHLQELEG